jgi:hypothetical protein
VQIRVPAEDLHTGKVPLAQAIQKQHKHSPFQNQPVNTNPKNGNNILKNKGKLLHYLRPEKPNAKSIVKNMTHLVNLLIELGLKMTLVS